MEKREKPVHHMPWFPQDWLSSALRGELALERDHMARLVYRELLDVLHTRGGYLPRTEVAGACLVTREDADKAVARLLTTGRIQETEDGRLFNQRILDDLAEGRDYRANRQASGAAGGRVTAERLTPEERSEAARRAAKARHAKHMRTDAAQPAQAGPHPAQHMRTDAQPPTPTPSPPPTPAGRSQDASKNQVHAGAEAQAAEPAGRVDAAWSLGVVAAAAYRPTASRWELTPARRKHVQALLRDHPDEGPEVFARVVHGYRYARRSWEEIDAHFEADTLLRAGNRAKYLEAFHEATARGLSPPFAREARAAPAPARASARPLIGNWPSRRTAP